METDMEIDEDCGEYEEEEFLVYVDIEPTSLSVDQIREAKTLKIFGLETKKPLLQINNQFYEGEFDYSMGTHVFFERDEQRPVDELYCKTDCYYRFCEKTNKVLKMSRVLLQDKSADTAVAQDKDISGIKGQLKVTKTYEQALNLFLAPGRKQPRRIPDELNCEHLLRSDVTAESSDEAENAT